MSDAPYPIPRVVRSKGYRSKEPTAHGVSSNQFAYGELRASVSDTEKVFRGNVGNGAQDPVGLIGLALALRARIIR